MREIKQLFEYWLPKDFDGKLQRYLANGFEIVKEDKKKVILKKKKSFGWLSFIIGSILLSIILGLIIGVVVMLIFEIILYYIGVDQIRTLEKSKKKSK
ncbi:MAG: hypothetical protein ACFFG0_44025 [Candidatus Thorarchaeota archaeon]